MRVTSTGEVTIPREVLKRLGIAPGSEVEFEIDADGARLVPAGEPADPSPRRGPTGPASVAMSAEEIPALSRCHD